MVINKSIILGLGIVFASASIAQAKGAGKMKAHKRVVNGLKSGKITDAEMSELKAKRVEFKAAKEQLKIDGVTKEERVKVKEMRKDMSKSIYEAKHNDANNEINQNAQKKEIKQDMKEARQEKKSDMKSQKAEFMESRNALRKRFKEAQAKEERQQIRQEMKDLVASKRTNKEAIKAEFKANRTQIQEKRKEFKENKIQNVGSNVWGE